MSGRVLSDKVTVFCQVALITAVYVLLFWPIIPGLIADWSEHPSLSYGFFVPFISAYLLWQQKTELKGIPLAPSSWGLFLLIAAVVLFLAGQLAADTFIMRIAMLLMLVGLVQLLLGNNYLKAFAFPLFYLALMIPPPYALVKQIVNFLMFLDATLTEKMLQLFGIPVYLEMNFLHLPNITLEVADVCSGIASIAALFVLGVIYAYLLPIPTLLKILLAAGTVPLAVLANLVRIIVTVALTYYWGPAVLGYFFHTFQGTLNFFACVLLLIVLGEALRRNYGTAPTARDVTKYKLPDVSQPIKTAWTTTGIAVLVLAGGALAAGLLEKNFRSGHDVGLNRFPLSFGAHVARIGAWADTYNDPRVTGAISRFYATANGIPIEVFIGYQANAVVAGRLQSPRLIFPERWDYVWTKSAQLTVPSGKNVQVNWMLTQRGPAKRLVLYWYQARGVTFTGELYYRVALLKGRLLRGGSEIIVVRMSTQLADGENVDSAEQRLKEFAVVVQPELTKLTEHNDGKTDL